MFRKAILLLIGVSSLQWSCASAGQPHLYTNKNWGFSTSLPDSTIYETDPPPNPNHGFRVPISNEAFVWVNADSSDDQSSFSATDTEVGYWKQSGCTEFKRNKTTLGQRTAYNVIIMCHDKKDRTLVKTVRLIVALASPRGIGNSAYVIGSVYATKNEEEKALSIQESIRRGFKFFISHTR